MEYLYSFLLNFFDLLSLLNLNDIIFEPKTINPKIKFSLLSIYILISFIITNFLFKELFAVKALIFIIFTTYIIGYIYSGNILKKIFTSCFWYLLILVTEYITAFIMSNIFKISYEKLLNNYIAFIILAVSARFVIYFITLMIKKYFKNRPELTVKKWMQLSIFPFVSIFTCFIFVNIRLKTNSTSILLLVDAIGLVFANIIIIFIIGDLDQENKIKNEVSLLNQQIKIEMNNAQAMTEAYNVQRKMTHDFENQLHAIQGLIQENHSSEADDYISSLLKNVTKKTFVVKSNNTIVDALLNQKYMLAQNSDIAVDFKINDLSDVNISSEDLVTIIANAMDNAIQAAKTCVGKKYIKIRLLKNKDEFIISIINTVPKNVEVRNNNIINTNNSIEHGFGLNNLKNALNHYEHVLSIKCENGIFRLSAIVYQ